MSTFGLLKNGLDSVVISQPMVERADIERGLRILEAIKGSDNTQRSAAIALGVTPQAVTKWIKKGSISREHLYGLSKLTDYTVEYIDMGRGSKRQGNTHPGPYIQRLCPLISWVSAGRWQDVIDNLHPGEGDDWLPCPVACSPETFVLRVEGDSMDNGRADGYHAGQLIFVDPRVETAHGSYIVVRLPDSEHAVFKQLIYDADKPYLKALNPHWPNPYMALPEDAIVVGPVIFKGSKV